MAEAHRYVYGQANEATESVSARFSLDIFNLTNTPSLDVPANFIFQNSTFNGAPVVGTPPLNASGSFYSVASGLGLVHNTIGSARQIQMSLQLGF